MKTQRPLLLLAFAIAVLLAHPACNGFFVDDVTDEGQFVFVANNNGGTPGSVSGFLIDEFNGSLSQLTGSPFAAGTGPVDLDADADGTLLYVANQGGTISGFAIDANTGALTQVTGSPFSVTAPVSIAVDPAGRFVYILGAAGDVSPRRINSAGTLEIAGTGSQAGSSPQEVRVAPSGALVYVAGGDTGTFVFTVNSTDGSLTHTQTVIPATSGFHSDVVMEPQGEFAYVLDFANDRVHAYTVDSPNGQLAEITGSPFETGDGPVAIAADPTGQFIYVVNRTSGDVSAYSIGNDGALTAIANSPFDAGTSPSSLAVDPSGSFLYVGNDGSNNLSIFQIGSSGALSSLGTRSTGTDPVAVVAVP
jgi:6-phosphogluconolactonase (cycloisomerase 2 family)